TLFCNLVDGSEVRVYRVLIDQRTYMIVLIQRIANPELLIGLHQFIGKLLINALVNNNSAGGDTALSCCPYRTEYGGWKSNIKVCMLAEDHRVIPDRKSVV